MLHQALDMSAYWEDLDRLARFNRTSESARSVEDEIEIAVKNHVSVNASKIKRQSAEDEARRQAEMEAAGRAHDEAIVTGASSESDSVRAARKRLSQ